jgi:hypothetical protein
MTSLEPTPRAQEILTDTPRTVGEFATAGTIETPDSYPEYNLPDVPDGVISGQELNDWAEGNNFRAHKRGTLTNGEAFAYVKYCHEVKQEADVEPALSAMRELTRIGMLHPATKWGAFKRDDSSSYQLFAVAPRLTTMANLKPGDASAEFEQVRKPYSDESSAKLDWVRRLDPSATVEKVIPEPPPKRTTSTEPIYDFFGGDGGSYAGGSPPARDEIITDHPLAKLINLVEAGHTDNWGWDERGTYPIDVEVINIVNLAGGEEKMEAIREWYASRQPAVEGQQ